MKIGFWGVGRVGGSGWVLFFLFFVALWSRHTFNWWQFMGSNYIEITYVVSRLQKGRKLILAPGNHGPKAPMSVFRCNMVKIDVWDNQGPYALLYSPKNCEINHCFSSLMHVRLVKAQENNYPSLLYPTGVPRGLCQHCTEGVEFFRLRLAVSVDIPI